MSKLIIPGWQSWTPVNPDLIGKLSNCYYSPSGISKWEIPEILSKRVKPIAGWCSYYAFGTRINESKILSNSVSLGKCQTRMKKFVVVDDGWCDWGEWFSPHTTKFPNGLKWLASQIKNDENEPGLWLAPFLTNIKTKQRLPVFPYKYIVDINDFDLMSILKTVVEDWGFTFIKLDFLYAIYYWPGFKTSLAADDFLNSLFKKIKNKYPDVHLNLCGCPIGPAIGVADSLRISSDIISPLFDNIWPINTILHTSRLNQLENNLMARENIGKFCLLDPDVFTVRKSTGFSKMQIEKLRKLILKANGVYFLGDDLTSQSPDSDIFSIFSQIRTSKDHS